MNNKSIFTEKKKHFYSYLPHIFTTATGYAYWPRAVFTTLCFLCNLVGKKS